jgi:hypothetical protein
MGRLSIIEGASAGAMLSVSLLLILATPAVAQQAPVPCTANCELVIVLPSDDSKPPEVRPDQVRFHVAGDTEVTIRLKKPFLQPGGKAATVLRFSQPAFVNPGGQEMLTVPLTPGRNVFRTMPAGACPSEGDGGGCKYDVKNVGNPDRPPLDPWIIIDR